MSSAVGEVFQFTSLFFFVWVVCENDQAVTNLPQTNPFDVKNFECRARCCGAVVHAKREDESIHTNVQSQSTFVIIYIYVCIHLYKKKI